MRQPTGQYFKSQSLQGVACKDGSGFIKSTMTGRPASPQVVIVHGRKVIVYQRVSVDQFDCTRHRIEVFQIQTQSCAGCVNQYRPESFASVKSGIAHGLMQDSGIFNRSRQAPIHNGFETKPPG